jgi:hypothetical protein
MTHLSQPGRPWLEIIIPARNEENRLPAGLALLSAKAATLPPGVAIIVVDSASTDTTAAIARQWPATSVPVRLLTCGRPGKGAAVKAGLLASTAPYVGFCDADMAADLSALDSVVELLTSGSRMVLGSRAHPDSEVEDRHSMIRRTGAAVFRAAAGLVAPQVGDTQCGFKFFDGELARAAAADLRTAGFAFDIELISRCRQLGAEPTEIPVRWRDMPGSTFSVWRHSLIAFAEVAMIWLALRARSAWPAGQAGGLTVRGAEPPEPVLGGSPAPAASPAVAGPADFGGLEPVWSESA